MKGRQPSLACFTRQAKKKYIRARLIDIINVRHNVLLYYNVKVLLGSSSSNEVDHFGYVGVSQRRFLFAPRVKNDLKWTSPGAATWRHSQLCFFWRVCIQSNLISSMPSPTAYRGSKTAKEKGNTTQKVKRKYILYNPSQTEGNIYIYFTT